MTMKAKAAVKQVAAYYLYCWACRGELESPSGSLMFTHEECDGRVVTCPMCQAPTKLPVMK